MVDFEDTFSAMEADGLEHLAATLREPVTEAIDPGRNGHWSRWLNGFARLPRVDKCWLERQPGHGRHADSKVLAISTEDPLPADVLSDALKAFHPWRKGPFCVFGQVIDTEWRSDWKWERVRPYLPNINGLRVLDIGSGNGYFGWQLQLEGAKSILGVDPFLVYSLQCDVIRNYVGGRNRVLPVGVESIPPDLAAFDLVLSLGVLYHRKNPLAHLQAVRGATAPGGTVVVETLVTPHGVPSLSPGERYAKMRNVHTIPSVEQVMKWLREAEFVNAACVDLSATTTREQKTTEWMTFESLDRFLDPKDSSKTVEGYPAPIRAIFFAQR